MRQCSPDELADAWIAFTNSPTGSQANEDLFWAFDDVYWVVQGDPAVGLDLILRILSKDSSGRIQENLSAGPLENLLAYHGEKIIARVEEEAFRNPLFKRLLGGVWQNSMSPEVWRRVQIVWDRRGWDGIPE